MVGNVPEVSADLRKPVFAEDVCLQPMKLKLIFLFVIESSRLKHLVFGKRISFSEASERAEFRELSDPGMNRVVWHNGASAASDVSLGLLNGTAEIVGGDRF